MSGQAIFEAHYIDYAIKMHGEQQYGTNPYYFHLEEVSQVLLDFGFDEYKYQASAWLHDILEDTETTLEALAKNFGPEVAALVFACTGEGSNRKERVNSILKKLESLPIACVVELADRIADIETGLEEENKEKLSMYKKEHEAFEAVVKNHVPENMWNRLQEAIDQIN